MIRKFRIIRTLFLLILYTLGTYLFYWPVHRVIRRHTYWRQRWRNGYMRLWSKALCRILRIRVTVEGEPPSAPFFLVSNHLSYIDIVPVFLTTRATFVAKQDVRHWPLLGYIVYTMGVLFVDRERRSDVVRVNRLIRKALTPLQGLVLFPEGTTSGGDAVYPFKPSLLEIPAQSGVPVHVASIRYETDEASGDPPAEESVCFYRAREPFHKHLFKMAANRRINCTIRFGTHTVESPDRKELAQRLRDEVEQIFEPMG
ncbi:MAG: lysophospholipid acyltransferase family protein [Balneolaceae bacterium]